MEAVAEATDLYIEERSFIAFTSQREGQKTCSKKVSLVSSWKKGGREWD